ncbi:phosphoglycerate mutase family protein [Kitasatospora sp. MMS16-BH015]|uniref:phosphoglycerate mutase family protein n=1 Tax=Kitasatospora sp. MMS16-BH015 TaxID=2018025 RepID=UPI000CF1CFF9|nr:phosphoglycerate mutase family protein [Kitasatospora sp. MMS16-BH015]
MAVEIAYETHSTTADNEAGIATGRLADELSELGRRQARELGARRPGHGFAAAFVSDPHRAVQTARIAFRDGPPLSIRTSGCTTATTVIPTEAHSPTSPLNQPGTSTNGSPAARVTARSSGPPTPSATTSFPGGRAAESWQSPARPSGGTLPPGRPSNDMLDTPPAWRPDWPDTLLADWTDSAGCTWTEPLQDWIVPAALSSRSGSGPVMGCCNDPEARIVGAGTHSRQWGQASGSEARGRAVE